MYVPALLDYKRERAARYQGTKERKGKKKEIQALLYSGSGHPVLRAILIPEDVGYYT